MGEAFESGVSCWVRWGTRRGRAPNLTLGRPPRPSRRPCESGSPSSGTASSSTLPACIVHSARALRSIDTDCMRQGGNVPGPVAPRPGAACKGGRRSRVRGTTPSVRHKKILLNAYSSRVQGS
jgi:hypothetical protein